MKNEAQSVSVDFSPQECYDIFDVPCGAFPQSTIRLRGGMRINQINMEETHVKTNAQPNIPQSQATNNPRLKALKAAFPHTIPIFAGFWFLGLAYGIYMNVSGFSFLYPFLMSITIFGGSLEFVAVSMLLAPFAPLQTLMMTLMIQARHLFYGISMLDKYKDMGWKKYYLIFGMCDESFSINYTAKIPDGVDKGWFYFFVTLLNQFYWVSGSTLGGVLGSLLHFDTEGLDFVMTAMFVVIFMEQLQKEQKHYTAIVGTGAALLCRVLFGADSFMLPTMLCILLLLTIFRKPLEKAGGLV